MAKKKPVPGEPSISVDTNSFELDGKKYRFKVAALIVPGHGKLTAKECLTVPEALQYLVENGSSVIEEIV